MFFFFFFSRQLTIPPVMPLLPKFFLFGLNIYLCKGNICFILSLILSFFPNLLNMLPLFIWELGVSSTFMQRRQRHPTPVLLPGKSHGQRSLVGCRPWGCKVGNDWASSLSLFTFMRWRRKWQPTPVFLPGESQGRGSLVGCRLWGRTESDTTEAT